MARTRKYKTISRGESKVTPRKDVVDFDDLVGGGGQGRSFKHFLSVSKFTRTRFRRCSQKA